MGGADDADIHRDFTIVTHAGNMLFLQHAQKLYLHIHGQFANLVKEDGSAVGFFKKSFARFNGTRKRTLGMPEQKGFHQMFRNSTAVHRHKGFVCAGAMSMNIAGNDFFTGSRFATDNHGHGEHGQFIGQMLPMSYLMLTPVAVADGFLVKLLLLVKRHLVFTDRAVSCLRTISWCCFLEAGLCALSAILYFRIHLALFFVAGFLGLVLRVVKNVIEEAVALKAENDFTV